MKKKLGSQGADRHCPGYMYSLVLCFHKARSNGHRDGTVLALVIKNANTLAVFRQDQAVHAVLDAEHVA